MVQGALCPRHRADSETDPQKLIETIRSCCSQASDFIPPHLPLLASIFRLILAEGNQPVAIEKLAERLSSLRGESLYPQTLSRLLIIEPRFYGLRPEAAPEQTK